MHVVKCLEDPSKHQIIDFDFVAKSVKYELGNKFPFLTEHLSDEARESSLTGESVTS